MLKGAFKSILVYILVVVTAISLLSGCSLTIPELQPDPEISELNIVNGDRFTLKVGATIQLKLNIPVEYSAKVEWSATNGAITVTDDGLVTAVVPGTVTVNVKWNEYSDKALFTVIEAGDNKVDDLEKDDFYDNYKPAASHKEAVERSELGLMSGSLTVPDQAPTISDYQPKSEGLFIRNDEPHYIDENTYVIVDAYGIEVMRIYRGGGYITLEEVAAYVYAFGDVPANYVKGKNLEPESSIWGEYLRLNHSSFSGNTKKYPYEPELPNINGCGGELYYYEIDIGTTGTTCDPKYGAAIYNNGSSIIRGAARIVYTRFDADRNNIIDPNEKFVFYTYNHYNDFQEYLNYYGGWGEMFGNITGGGTISSKYDYAPTPYVPVIFASLTQDTPDTSSVIYAWVDRRAFEILLCA